MRRDLRRAAWLGWMTPLAAALSILRIAATTLSWASSDDAVTAARALLVRVRSSERTALLRSRRTSFCLMRLI